MTSLGPAVLSRVSPQRMRQCKHAADAHIELTQEDEQGATAKRGLDPESETGQVCVLGWEPGLCTGESAPTEPPSGARN